MSMAWRGAWLPAALAAGSCAVGWLAGSSAAAVQEPASPAAGELAARFAEQGVRLDLERKTISVQAKISSLREPLEYLLVLQPQGKDYESLLLCEDVSAEALNAAMLLLGVERGTNGSITAADPAPTLEEIQNGADPSVVKPAEGDGFYIYVAWEEQLGGRAEPFCYRAEDLVINARSEGTYQRGKWVYLGSRFVRPHKDAPELFAAQGEGNLVSLCIFEPANHLLTGADPESDDEQIWFSNVFLLPPAGHPVTVTFAREPWSGPLQ
jgi:hypothetical protein